MRKKTLSNGVEIPVLGLGTWELRGEECEKVTRKALEIGYDHIDTADMYDNEDRIGPAIADSDRSNLFITSKVQPDDLSHKGVLETWERSASKLGVDYIDLHLIHWPRRGMDASGTLKAFKTLLDQGKIRAMGVSNFTINHLKDFLPLAKDMNVEVTVNQVEFHPFLNQTELLEYCDAHDVAVTAYSPLARGDVLGDETIKEIADELNRPPAQVVLSWLLGKGLVAIPKSSKPDHLTDNLKALDLTLDEESTRRIDAIDRWERKINPSWAEFDE